MRKLAIILAILLIFVAAGCTKPAESEKPVESANQGSGVKVETERKFLVNPENIPDDYETRGDVFVLEQSYISFSPEIRMRKVNDSYYYMTLKTPVGDGLLSREETETYLTEEEYLHLLTKQEGVTIQKTRYQFEEDGYEVGMDIFSGDLKGLVFAEVEFPSEEAARAYVPPAWFGEDVTMLKEYKNGSLAQNGKPSRNVAEITYDGKVVRTINLVDGQVDGYTAYDEYDNEICCVEVENGKVRFMRSTCPDQICVNTGWFGHAGDFAACITNKVVVMVK